MFFSLFGLLAEDGIDLMVVMAEEERCFVALNACIEERGGILWLLPQGVSFNVYSIYTYK